MGRNQRRRADRQRETSGCGVRLVKVHRGPEPGDGVATASLEEVESALRDQPEDLNWDWASNHLIPVMPRVRPYPAGFPEPLRTMVAPGVAVGFAIDVGPAFMGVGQDLLRSWGLSLGDIHARALSNVVVRAADVAASDIFEGGVGDAPTRWLQTGQSIGSVLVLVPDELARLFGPAPAFFITPMRDLIIGLPADVDRELAAWLWLEVATLDPNCLGPTGYRFDGHTVTPESLETSVGAAFEPDHPPGQAYVA